jgi:hypothetical protein
MFSFSIILRITEKDFEVILIHSFKQMTQPNQANF